MDQGLGLKNTHPVDDFASSSDIRISKDNSGPVYESKETERAFILTANLKGYRKEHVEIDVSEDGTWISIGLEKPVQENVMSGRSTKKKKVFRIPDGVELSRIKAKFNELESTLRIDMPKVKKGVVGVRVEEVKEEKAGKKDGDEVKEEGADIGTPQIAKAASDVVPEKDGEKVKEELADMGTPQITQAANDEVPEKDGEEVRGGSDIRTPQITQAANDEVPEKDGEEVRGGSDIRTPQITQAASDEVLERDGEKMKVGENNHAKGKEVDKEENRNEIPELQAENSSEIRESEESKIVKSKQADGIEKKREDAKETIKEEKHGEVENDKSTETSHQDAALSQETEVVTEPRIEKQNRQEQKEVDECESSQMGKGKDVGGKSTPETKPAATEKSNPLRTPLIIVGSAILVSIVLLAINRIRNRKRWI